MNIDVQTAVSWMDTANKYIQDNKDHLTKLDQATGDGDHGINMARGFTEVSKKISKTDYQTPGEFFKDTAMTLMSKIGGASGPLYGTAFLRLATVCKDENPVVFPTFVKALQAATEGIKQRGKAEAGEKTMIDVWEPVAGYFQAASSIDADELAKTAEKAMEATRDLTATKGRAAYFKERSKGTIDPGAASSCYMFLALAEVLKGV